MFEIKQSTAIDIVFFAHDANGDAVTGKVDGDFTKRISKNGGVFAAMTVTIAERENGWYHAQLSTAHTDTLGLVTLTFTATGVKQVNNHFMVRAVTVDDLVRAQTPADLLDADKVTLGAKALVNKREHTVATGVDQVYDDDGSTVLRTLTPSESGGVITVAAT
jgi:hypothetical protein